MHRLALHGDQIEADLDAWQIVVGVTASGAGHTARPGARAATLSRQPN
jgi:hypothetical protein